MQDNSSTNRKKGTKNLRKNSANREKRMLSHCLKTQMNRILKGQGHKTRIAWNWYGWIDLIFYCHRILVKMVLTVPSIFYLSFKFLCRVPTHFAFENHLSFQKMREDLSLLLKSVFICSWSFSNVTRDHNSLLKTQ